ncbi:DUF255 domain-containing protein [Paenibacillus validus]|uniref:DUF255 domain-containing protein n=1 Tax=Paenibacillus validus TaxID=44253 RepID=UPI003D296D84
MLRQRRALACTFPDGKFPNAPRRMTFVLDRKRNSVEWYPWSEEAFEKAKQENKPVFLSMGYS